MSISYDSHGRRYDVSGALARLSLGEWQKKEYVPIRTITVRVDYGSPLAAAKALGAGLVQADFRGQPVDASAVRAVLDEYARTQCVHGSVYTVVSDESTTRGERR